LGIQGIPKPQKAAKAKKKQWRKRQEPWHPLRPRQFDAQVPWACMAMNGTPDVNEREAPDLWREWKESAEL
jgi:hypothetical protein